MELNASTKEESIKKSISETQIEELVWTASHDQFNTIDSFLVEQIRIEPKYYFNYCLLSHLNLRRFSENPTNFHLFSSAIELSKQCLELNTESDLAKIYAADLLDLIGKENEAKALLNLAANKNSWHYEFANARLNANRNGPEITFKIIKQGYLNPASSKKIIDQYLLSILRISWPQNEQISKLNQIKKIYSSLSLMSYEAQIHTNLKAYDKALALYDNILRQAPGHLTSILSKMVINFYFLHNKSRASKLLLLAKSTPNIQLTDDQIYMLEFHEILITWNDKSKVHKATNDKRRIDRLAQIIANQIDLWEHLPYVISFFIEHKMTKQLIEFTNSLNLYLPGKAELYALKAEISGQLLDYKDAIQSYENALLLDSENDKFYSNLGHFYFLEGNYQKSLQAQNTALEIDPTNAIAMYRKAETLLLFKNKKEAERYFRNAIQVNPNIKLLMKKNNYLNIPTQ